MYSNLGGVTHGQLGLFLTNTQNSLISQAKCIRPNQLGQLIISVNTTVFISTMQCDTLTEDPHVLGKVMLFEQDLIEQIIAALN